MEEHNYQIVNLDATIIAQRPKMAPHIPQMVKNVAESLHIDESQVKIKADYRRGTWIYGTGEGISSQAICSLMPITAYIDEDIAATRRSCEGCGGCQRK